VRSPSQTSFHHAGLPGRFAADYVCCYTLLGTYARGTKLMTARGEPCLSRRFATTLPQHYKSARAFCLTD
jgi:hypothetical protein